MKHSAAISFNSSSLSSHDTAPFAFAVLLFWARGGGGEGGISLQEANGDVPLDGVAFSRLDWL